MGAAVGIRALAATSLLVWSVSAQAGMDEMSAGAIVGMAMPTYGKFKDIAKARGEPGFNTKMLFLGSHATFVNRGFVTGGRLLVGSTKSQSSTSGSHYGFYTLGFLFGYALDMGPLDFTTGAELGIGEIDFATGNAASGGVVQVDYLNAAPVVSLGINLLSNFKISFMGSYLYGLPYRVSQFGTQLLSNPADAKASGIVGGVQLSFGFFK